MKNLCYSLIALMMSIPLPADEVSTAKTDNYVATGASPVASSVASTQPVFLNVYNSEKFVIDLDKLNEIFYNPDSSSIINRLKAYFNSMGFFIKENDKGAIQFTIIDSKPANIKSKKKHSSSVQIEDTQFTKVLNEIKDGIDCISKREFHAVVITLQYTEESKELFAELNFVDHDYSEQSLKEFFRDPQ